MNYTTIPFDDQKFNFVSKIRHLFEKISLDTLHEIADRKYDTLFEVGKDSCTIFHKKFYDKYREGWDMELLYNEFIAEVIAPLYDEDFLYQKFPTGRFHLPNNIAVGAFHTDAEFGHPAGEVNYIIPLTNSKDTASVWVENGEDFEPMELKVGHLVCFNGNGLRHGNKVNLTGKTRCSMDFRILPLSKYNEANESASVTLGTKFKPNEYYKLFRK